MSDAIAQLIFLLIKAVLMPVLIVIMVAFIIYFERKFAGFFQGRVGPTYLGPWGSLQSFGDILKLLSKEDLMPDEADKPVFRLAPYIVFIPAFLVMAVLPFGPVGGEPNLFGYRVRLRDRQLRRRPGAVPGHGRHRRLRGGAGRLVVQQQLLAAGRPARRRPDDLLRAGHGLLGGGRHAHGRLLNLVDIVDGQAGNFWDWYFIPQMVGGVIFFIATLAELNRTPFDLAEAEQELVAGYLTEYSGMRWGIFMFAEYVNMVVISGIVSTLYFGGWRAPFEVLDFIPGPIWLFAQDLRLDVHLHVDALDHLPLPLQPADVHRLEGAAASVHRQPGRHGHRRERGGLTWA